MKKYERILSHLVSKHWLIEEDWLRLMLAIAERSEDVTALKARLDAPLQSASDYASVRDNVAVLDLRGPIFAYSNMMTELCGATSLSRLAKDFKAAEENPDIDTIVHYIDTPGGQVTGTNEYSELVKNSNKKTIAYVSGTAASAGYWIASAHDEIVVDKTSRLGSIGVVVALPPKDEGVIEIVNSTSPNKRIDPETDEGRAVIVKELDALAEVFQKTVAKNRNVSLETVVSDFGKGGILVGEDAINIKMADRLGSFEELMEELTDSGSSHHYVPGDGVDAKKDNGDSEIMDRKELKAKYPDLYAEILDEGKAQGKAEAEKIAAEKVDSVATKYQEKLSAAEERIAALEKAEAQRSIEMAAKEAVAYVDKSLLASDLPEAVYGKIKAALAGQIKAVAGGSMEQADFESAVAEEIKSWSDILASAATVTGIGGNAKDVTGDFDEADVDAVVDRMLDHVQS